MTQSQLLQMAVEILERLEIRYALVGSLASSTLGEARFSRRRQPVLEAGECYVASPEDIILGKLLYYQDGGSEKHLRDIAGIWKRKGGQLDMTYLESKVRHLRLQPAWQPLRTTLEQS